MTGSVSAARAGEPAPSSSPSSPAASAPSPHERWYGYQTLLADAGALAVLVAGVAAHDRGTGQGIQIAAGAVYVVGGPLVHLAHGRAQASLGSLGLRVGVPLAGGLIGIGVAALAPDDDGDEYVVGTALGVLGGAAGAVALDAMLVAWERDPRGAPEPAASVPTASRNGWHPSLILTAARVQLGVVGVF